MQRHAVPERISFPQFRKVCALIVKRQRFTAFAVPVNAGFECPIETDTADEQILIEARGLKPVWIQANRECFQHGFIIAFPGASE